MTHIHNKTKWNMAEQNKQCEHKLRNAIYVLFSENNRDNQVLNEYYFRFSSIYFVFFEIISRIIGNFIVAIRK